MGDKHRWRTGNNIMTFAAIIALLVGATLAQRFRVFVLVPVLTLTILVAFGIVIMVGADAWQAALVATVAIVGVQVGYLANAPFRVRDIVARGRVPRSAAIEKPKSAVDPLAVN
jgi:hypothetical protein